jgi:arylsulfatase A
MSRAWSAVLTTPRERERGNMRRSSTLVAILLAALSAASGQAPRPPNIIIIMADDLGYGDLGCYGHPSIRTPNLDRMAAEGIRFTDFYSSAPVCTPSRAGLMTGRLPVRTGMSSNTRRVLFPDSAGGLPADEITIARALKSRGYATACVGKWHLGHLPQYLPTRHGFDFYFGIPYSNDMDRDPASPQGRDGMFNPRIEYWKVPLLRNEAEVERPVDQQTLTRRYTEEALRWIGQNKDRPFFLYFPHTFPHVPLFASDKFRGTSPRGLYGDVVEELDWSVGQVLDLLRRERLSENTFVFFTSDNGPWLPQEHHGGSAGLLREGKGSTWEGGMRVPGIAWWPGRIRSGATTRELAVNLDLFPTSLALAGAALPADRVLDGSDMAPILFGSGKSNRQTVFFYRDEQVYAVRKGAYKAHLVTQPGYGSEPPMRQHDPPLLYNLAEDPSERFDLSAQQPGIVADLKSEVDRHRAGMVPGKPQLEARSND